MFSHEALLYDGPDGFLAGTLPFIREGLAADEPILVAVGAEKIAALRARARRRRRPRASSPTWPCSATTRRGSSPPGATSRTRNPGPIRGIGEPIWAGRSATELVECQLHESLLNVAFADRPTSGCCARTTPTALDGSVIHEACCSHPLVDGAAEPRLPRRRAPAGAVRLAAAAAARDRADARLRARHARRGAPAGRAQRAPRRPRRRRASRTSCSPSASWPPTASATAAGAGSCASGAPTTRSSARSATAATSPIRSPAASGPALEQLDGPRAVDRERGLRPRADPLERAGHRRPRPHDAC